jgi:hypothetical protein
MLIYKDKFVRCLEEYFPQHIGGYLNDWLEIKEVKF